jgi:hypothetical protein
MSGRHWFAAALERDKGDPDFVTIAGYDGMEFLADPTAGGDEGARATFMRLER